MTRALHRRALPRDEDNTNILFREKGVNFGAAHRLNAADVDEVRL